MSHSEFLTFLADFFIRFACILSEILVHSFVNTHFDNWNETVDIAESLRLFTWTNL